MTNGIERDDKDEGSNDIEHQMGTGGAFAGGTSGHSHYLCRQCGAEILAYH